MAFKIGVFDSGVGGLLVLLKLKEAFPNCEYIYFADTANLPYGNKSPEQLYKLTLNGITKLIDEFGVDLVVVACNSASTVLPDIMQKRPLLRAMVIDVISAGVSALSKQARARSTGLTALILGTRATVQSQEYEKRLGHLRGVKIDVFSQSCPLFVPLVEEKIFSGPILNHTIDLYLREWTGCDADQEGKHSVPNCVLLACTHYPYLRDPIQDHFGKEVKVLDSAEAIVNEVECSSALSQIAKSKLNPDRESVLLTASDQLGRLFEFYKTAEEFFNCSSR